MGSSISRFTLTVSPLLAVKSFMFDILTSPLCFFITALTRDNPIPRFKVLYASSTNFEIL